MILVFDIARVLIDYYVDVKVYISTIELNSNLLYQHFGYFVYCDHEDVNVGLIRNYVNEFIEGIKENNMNSINQF